VVKVLRSFGIYFHNRAARIGDFTVLFYGGSNSTPFGTPWEVEEDIIYSDLKKLFTDNPEGPKILAVHAPPKDTKCDVIPGDIHVGSESIKKIIEEFSPEFVICSHIHECAGKTDTLGTSQIANIGMLGKGHLVEITKEGIEHIKL
jgi:Icc-related predicted phosphoesterase